MLSSTLSAVAFMAAGAFALPTPNAPTPAATSGNYSINVLNKCSSVQHFAMYQIDQAATPWTVNQLTDVMSLESGKNGSLSIPFGTVAARLSNKGGQPTSAQWLPQSLVEFGHTAFQYMGADVVGTSFDLSMIKSDLGLNDGLSVCPTNCPSNCKSKLAGAVAKLSQVWTKESQTANGSPADTMCANSGITNFDVVWNACS